MIKYWHFVMIQKYSYFSMDFHLISTIDNKENILLNNSSLWNNLQFLSIYCNLEEHFKHLKL